MAAISDKAAKEIFRRPYYWPRTTDVFSLDHSQWIQGRPKRTEPNFKGVTFPHLYTAGSLHFWIEPDCLYFRVSGEGLSRCCDIISVEASNALQNFQTKRGRYVGTESAMFINLPKSWLESPMETTKTYAQYLKIEDELALASPEIRIPIRTIRVMYFLDADYFRKNNRIKSIDPRPWEYFLPNTSIKSFNAPPMRRFAKTISPDAQFYGWA